MNQRIEKSANILLLNRDQEGAELWVGMYDLLFDYQVLLLDYNTLVAKVPVLERQIEELVSENRMLSEVSNLTQDDDPVDYEPDGSPSPRTPARLRRWWPDAEAEDPPED